jgi:tetratricopeptide (TPR) repeat protein
MIAITKQLLVLIFLVPLFCACGGQDKKDAADFFLKANQALTQKNYADAIRLYDEAIAKNADFSDAFLNKGITLLQMGNAEQAYEILTEAIQLDPTLVQANLVRSEAAYELGLLTEALADLNQIEKQYKDSTRYFLVKGNILAAQGNDQAASAAFDRSISLNKANVEAYVNRGALYYQLRTFAEARADFEAALTLNPGHPQALNNLGLLFSRAKNWSAALACFDKVLNREPDNAYSLNNKGYVLLNTGFAEEGKALIEKSLDKMPENGYAFRNLGIYYMQKGNTSEAIQHYQKAIDIAEPVEMLYGLTGQAYFRNKQLDEACKVWKQGVILKDSMAIALKTENCR